MNALEDRSGIACRTLRERMPPRAERSVRIGLCLMVAWSLTNAFVGGTVGADEPHVWPLERLNQAPEFRWIDDRSPVRSLAYGNEPFRGEPTEVFAFYATPGTLAGDPSLDRDLPAVVLVHGGGGTAFEEWARLWAERGYAAIAMDLAGARPITGRNPHEASSREPMEHAGPGQGDDEKFGAIDLPLDQHWTYHAVAAVIRAHSLVRSFPEIDRSRTAVTGISWGGYLTCIVAGVDDRFAAAVPVYGCGFLGDNSAWLGQFARMNETQRERWLSHWDPSVHLPRVSMPILFVNGTNDGAYPLDSYVRSYDLVPGEKRICVTVNMPHSHPAGWAPVEIGRFIDQVLLGKRPLVHLDRPTAENDRWSCRVVGPTEAASAQLHWTGVSDAPINRREWQTRDVAVVDGRLDIGSLPADAVIWFVTARDDSGAVVSSTLFGIDGVTD